MKKTAFLTLEKAREITAQIPTPFHLYDEAGIRANARALNAAFAWNPGFKEFFAVKATPNPYILKLLHDEGCGDVLRRREFQSRGGVRLNFLFGAAGRRIVSHGGAKYCGIAGREDFRRCLVHVAGTYHVNSLYVFVPFFKAA